MLKLCKLLEFHELPCLIWQGQTALKGFCIGKFPAANYNVNWAAVEEESWGEYRKPERESKAGRFHCRAEHVPRPPPRIIGILCCQTAVSASAASLSNIKNWKVSFLLFLSIRPHSITHTHTCRATPGKINCHHGNNMHWQTHSLPGNEMPHNPLLPGAGV